MNTTTCCKCHKRIEFDEASETEGVYCDDCWDLENEIYSEEYSDSFDYYSDADIGL